MRPLDSAIAPLGVTEYVVVIPTGATNGVRIGMEESNQNTIPFILLEFFKQDEQDFQDDE